jgi:hypothetical protein
VCERKHIEVAAPIKRGAMKSDHFRPAQFVYDEATDTIRSLRRRRCARLASTPATEQSGIGRPHAAAAP